MSSIPESVVRKIQALLIPYASPGNAFQVTIEETEAPTISEEDWHLVLNRGGKGPWQGTRKNLFEVLHKNHGRMLWKWTARSHDAKPLFHSAGFTQNLWAINIALKNLGLPFELLQEKRAGDRRLIWIVRIPENR